jgi:hypothetical protein
MMANDPSIMRMMPITRAILNRVCDVMQLQGVVICLPQQVATSGSLSFPFGAGQAHSLIAGKSPDDDDDDDIISSVYRERITYIWIYY